MSSFNHPWGRYMAFMAMGNNLFKHDNRHLELLPSGLYILETLISLFLLERHKNS